MIVNVDFKSLEWCSYLYLSQDKIGIEEWNSVIENPDKYDIHKSNQIRYKLPGYLDAQNGINSEEAKFGRLIAKVFLFRWIYRGPAYAYASDPEFASVSKSTKYWQEIIDEYYSKYKGIYATHNKYIKEVNETGKLTSPLGRQYTFNKYRKGDSYQYSEYEITNYPNQGVGADLCAVARVITASRFSRYKLRSLLISTIHDSITADCPDEEVETVSEILIDVFKDLPKNIEKVFGIRWDLPMLGEISVGNNLKDLN